MNSTLASVQYHPVRLLLAFLPSKLASVQYYLVRLLLARSPLPPLSVRIPPCLSFSYVAGWDFVGGSETAPQHTSVWKTDFVWIHVRLIQSNQDGGGLSSWHNVNLIILLHVNIPADSCICRRIWREKRFNMCKALLTVMSSIFKILEMCADVMAISLVARGRRRKMTKEFGGLFRWSIKLEGLIQGCNNWFVFVSPCFY